MESEPKVPVVRRPDYTVYLERAYGREWIHFDVIRWSLSVRKSLKSDLDALMQLHGGPVFAWNTSNGFAKRQRFLKLMGWNWSFAHEADGKTHHIYARY